jgi:hypothetical protein
MTTKRLGQCLVLAGVCGLWAPNAVGQVVYHESFDHYGYAMPGLTGSCVMAEWPPSLKHLEFRPTKYDSVYQGGAFRLPKEAQGLTDYQFEFLFRFQREGPKALDFRLALLVNDGGKPPKHSACTMRISDDSSGVTSVGDVRSRLPATRTPMKETTLHPLLGGYWYRGLVRVQGTTLEMFIEGQGKLTRVGGAEIGVGPLAGFNFSGASPFDLDDIIVKKVPGLPVGDFRDEDGAKVANHAAEYALAFPTDANTASAKLRIGHPGEMRIHLNWADGSTTSLGVSTFSMSMTKPVIKDQPVVKDGKPVVERKQVAEPVTLPDAGLNFREITQKASRDDWRLSCNIRPWIEGYLDEDKLAVAANWEKYEAASKHYFKFEVRRGAGGIEYWIDGRYAGGRDSPTPLVEIVFVLPAEGAIKEASSSKVAREAGYLPLDITPIANPGVMASARLPVPAGEGRIQGIPFLVAPGSGNLDLSVVRENFGTWALECDFYLSRTAFSGMPETLMLSVPSAQYPTAYILCAVADDLSRDPVLTARLTRFVSGSAGGRGPAIADTMVVLPCAGQAETLPSGIVALGEVQYTEGGRPHKAPLYLVEVPLDCGSIQDVIFQEKFYSMVPQPYLDFEVLGKTDRALQQLDKEHKPDPSSRSAVHVFGITLKRSPVEMEVVPARVGNAYTTDEQPTMNVVLRCREKSDCRVAWEVRDVDGKLLDSGEQKIAFRSGEHRIIAVAPKVRRVGHYKAKFRLSGDDQRLLIEHTAPFAVVAPDSRKSGYESPYFTWWFNGAHLTCNDINVVGPLLKMAGIRRTLIKSEALGVPWKLTTGQIGNFTGRVAPEDLEKKKAEYAKKLDEALTAFPHADAANIFHESCGGEFPLEVFGIPMPLPTDEKQLAAQQNAVAGAMLTARLYREKCPHVRPTLVNTGDSLGGAAMLMRHKFPRELLTALGEESLGQTVPPEMSTAWNFYMLRELARKMGYGDVPVDACFEWKGRGVRDLGERKVAAWRLRDALIAHAWRCRLVPMSGTIEPGNSYYNSIWGHDYMFSRSPQNYPYMSFSTTAHLTHLLDGAKFSRQLATGTITVYTLEFRRGKERIYSLWTARGTAQVSLTFAQDVAAGLSDMFGRTQSVKTENKVLKLALSGEPCYVVAPAEVASVAVGKRAYPEDQVPSGARIQIADAMARPDRWQMTDKPDERLENVPRLGNKNYLPFRQLGKYQVRAVTDEDKGECLEVELVQEGDVVPFLPEYTVLRLRTPVPVDGAPTTVGVWVKGNSGWGQLMWEFEDADGERWLSCGTGGYWCDVYDWPKQASINFEGWNFLQFPIAQASPVRLPNPGEVSEQWRTSGGGNGRIDYPIKLTGVAVCMTRQALDLTEMKPVRTVVRLKDLSVYYIERHKHTTERKRANRDENSASQRTNREHSTVSCLADRFGCVALACTRLWSRPPAGKDFRHRVFRQQARVG